MDIQCRLAGLKPDAAVLVATARALKYHGGAAKNDTARENPAALKKGIANLGAHIDNLKKFGVPVVVAVNLIHLGFHWCILLLTSIPL